MLQRYSILLLLVVSSARIFSQHQDKVDFTKAEVSIQINPETRQITGKATYDFEVLANVDSVFMDARNIDFQSVRLNKKRIKYANNKRTITLYKRLKKGRNHTLLLTFKAKPKQAVYFLGFDDDIDGNEQIWTQGQGKYTSHWLPSFDDMEEKVEFDLDITYDASYGVIANGKLTNIKEGNGLNTWSFDMRNPMSSYLLAFAIGNYENQILTSAGGTPIKNYYNPEDREKAEPTYRYTKEIFDYLETEIGVPYPWQDYKQVPVKDFLYAGMENTGATIFSNAFVVDSVAFEDKNYVNVNAHELAHQWFGNLVTEKDGNHHWLHEGFATYYAYLSEKKIYGHDYFHWKLYDSAIQLREFSKDGNGEALTNPKASSLTFYEKGAWALVILRNQIGEVAFKQGIKNYLEKYKFKNVTITNFLDEMEATSGTSLEEYKRLWLDSPDFPFEKAKEYLRDNSTSVASLFNLKWELTTSLENKASIIQKYWDLAKDEALKARLIKNYHKIVSPDLIGDAFRSESIKIRQELALAYEKVPLDLKAAFESLLNDKSYVTLENALYRLWISFPQDRSEYLEKTKGIMGLPNKNVRLLWLLLATLTNDYDDKMKEGYLSELFGYTSPQYTIETRQSSFGLIGEVFEYSDQNIKDLINATVHHSWQFRKYARDLVESLLKDDDQRKRIINLSKQLKDDELRFINSKLNLQ